MTGRIGRSGLVGAIALTFVIAGTASATTAAPANDNWANRTQVAFFPFEDAFVDNSGASLEGMEPQPDCSGVGKTVWYGIFPTSNYTVRLRATPDSDLDVVLSIYEGSEIYALAQRGCMDYMGPGGRETLTVSVQAGHGYYVQVGGYSASHTRGTFTLRAKRLPAPANDNFATATTVALGSISYASTAGASVEDGEQLCIDNESKTVWYRYVPAETRTIVVSTVGSDFDTVLTAFYGTDLLGLTEFACNDDAIGLQSKLKLQVYAGNTYFLRVGGYNGAGGSLTFQLRQK
jgi:hypothetical protein